MTTTHEEATDLRELIQRLQAENDGLKADLARAQNELQNLTCQCSFCIAAGVVQPTPPPDSATVGGI